MRLFIIQPQIDRLEQEIDMLNAKLAPASILCPAWRAAAPLSSASGGDHNPAARSA